MTASGCWTESTPTVESAATGGANDPQTAAGVEGGSATVMSEVPGGTAGDSTRINLSPENTEIAFVGLHAGDEPNPRHGTFEQLSGTAVLEHGKLTSVQLAIDTRSVSTEIGRLTNHLKSPDFFDVNTYPEATFQSTSIQEEGDGRVTVTGDLTLHGVTKEVSFPATVSTDEGLKLDAEFSIDRTEFGMDYSVDKVVADVALKVSVDS
jgi:polyisoprenoid-binding protein YceI